MNFKDYVEKIGDFDIYPHHGTGDVYELMYLGNALAGEAGEVSGNISKVWRDGETVELMLKIKKELGDTLWGVAHLCRVYGWTIDELLLDNYVKLADRANRGVLGGSGDNR